LGTQKTGRRHWHHWGHKKQDGDAGIIGDTKNSPETLASLGTQKTVQRHWHHWGHKKQDGDKEIKKTNHTHNMRN
jgi:hypothetical protein